MAVSAEKRDEIIRALRVNSNATQVAKQTGVDKKTVRKIARRTDIELTAGKAAAGRTLPEETRAQVIAALEINPNASEVAKRFGLSHNMTVCRIARKAGIELTDSQSNKDKRRAQTIAVLQATGNASQAARELNISKVAVFRAARKAGIAPKNPEKAALMRERMKRRVAEPGFDLKRRVGNLLYWLESARDRGDQERLKALLHAAPKEVKVALFDELRDDNLHGIEAWSPSPPRTAPRLVTPRGLTPADAG